MSMITDDLAPSACSLWHWHCGRSDTPRRDSSKENLKDMDKDKDKDSLPGMPWMTSR